MLQAGGAVLDVGKHWAESSAVQVLYGCLFRHMQDWVCCGSPSRLMPKHHGGFDYKVPYTALQQSIEGSHQAVKVCSSKGSGAFANGNM